MARNYTAVPNEYLEEMDILTDEEFGRLVRSMIRYNLTGEPISPVGNERFFAKQVMAEQDRFSSKYKDISEKRKEAGKAGASKRWQMLSNDSKEKQSMANNSTAIAKDGGLDIVLDIESNTLDKRNTSNLEVVKEKENIKEKERNFERFWKAYPKKVGKGEAKKAFAKVKGVPVETLIEAVERQKQSKQWKADGGQYIPNPATWLNQERWEDDLTVDIQQESGNPFLDILREMEAKENGQETDNTGPVNPPGGIPVIL